MNLVPIPADRYDGYRLDAIFNCYKWDPQFSDSNTLARHVLVLTEREHAELSHLTENLDRETTQAEQMLNRDLTLTKPLALPGEIRRELGRMQNYEADRHVRLNRYDFHPTTSGAWAVSEVNSDVPGGFAEASLLPGAAIDVLGDDGYWYVDFGAILAAAVAQKAGPGGKVALIHCTCYSDDRQVMQFLGDKLADMGLTPIYAAADHLRFTENRAISILDGNRGEVDALVRFTPIEWLKDIRPRHWQGYFDTTTPSCNHPIAIFAQTKRFPLVWGALEARGLQFTTWRALLPETVTVKAARHREGFIYKPVFGRVGESVTIKEACWDGEYDRVMRDVRRHPKRYLAQRRFASRPLSDGSGRTFHVCLGAYCVDGRAAGYYARISPTPRIDSTAADIPVLIQGGTA